ncbi:4225_t:CDS:2, partial [Scutellospora calospora]
NVVYTSPKNYAIILQSALELIKSNILDGVIWATTRFNESELPSTFALSNEYQSVFKSWSVGSSHESIYTATPMLLLPIAFDQPGNAEKLELTGMALQLSKLDLKVDKSSNELAMLEGVRNENGELEVYNKVLMRHWITPDSRMGFIRGNYLDVFGAAMIIVLVMTTSLIYCFYKVIMFAFKKWTLRNRHSQEGSSKPKNE